MRSPLLCLLLALALILGACGDDDGEGKVKKSESNRWRVNSSINGDDMSQNQNQTNNNVNETTGNNVWQDMGAPLQDMGNQPVLDMAPSYDLAQDQGSGVDMNDWLAQQLVGEWIAINPFQLLPHTTGVAVKLKLLDDGSAYLGSDLLRRGRWKVLENQKVYLYDLDKQEDDDTTDLLVRTSVRDGELNRLSLPVGANTMIHFERPGSAGLRLEDLKGMWQSPQKVDNNLESIYVALRVDPVSDSAEYGVVRAGVFQSLITLPIALISYSTGEDYWHFRQTNNRPVPPLAGEIVEVEGKLELYAPVKMEGTMSNGREIFRSVKLEPVMEFASD